MGLMNAYQYDYTSTINYIDKHMFVIRKTIFKVHGDDNDISIIFWHMKLN